MDRAKHFNMLYESNKNKKTKKQLSIWTQQNDLKDKTSLIENLIMNRWSRS